MIRVLLADDSFLTLSILKDLIAQDPEIEIIGEAYDGRQAVDKVALLRPDLLIMDVMMPVMDGLTAVQEIMKISALPILILSADKSAGEQSNAFNAIRLGALDVMRKPEGLSGAAWDSFASTLLAQIHTLSRVRVIHHFRSPRKTTMVTPPRLFASTQRSIVAIGASTGGPKVVMKILKELPADGEVGIVIVQHIASGFAAGFAEWLNSESAYNVRLAKDGDLLERGVALVAPCEQHMEIRNGRVVLTSTPQVNGCRPSIDNLFFSLAKENATAVVAVLLTGMGKDGAEGLLALKEGGAYTIAQDEATCAVYGMPKVAMELGGVQEIQPALKIAAAITRQLA
jgi:two-component system, chemotaxis family, protein-glutamate methylesterase/glutaminase